jgi:GNAT superfamily N-acetyltransferase
MERDSGRAAKDGVLAGAVYPRRWPREMRLRRYRLADAEALADVYRDAARNLGRRRYTPEQTRVWARHPEDLEAFRTALSEGLTLCAIVGDSPVAFGQLNPPDHIAYLYCHSEHAGNGYASAILAGLEEQAISNRVARLHVEASCVARPFFDQHGYRVVEEERPVRHGVEFLRFKMEKALSRLGRA